MKKTIQFTFLLILALAGASLAQADSLSLDRTERIVRPGRPERPERPDRYERIVYISAGEVKTQKLLDETFSFSPRQWNERIIRIQLVGTKASVKINSARVEFLDGEVWPLDELQGRLREGHRMGAIINSRDIRAVHINAESDSLIGNRGQFRLEFGVAR